MPSWLTWTFAALLSWGLWAVLAKVLGDALTPGQSQALSTLGMLPILPMLLLSKNTSLRSASRRGLLLAFGGGVVTCLGNLALYSALARGEKVVAAVSLTALYPLVTILLAVLILRERLNWVQIAGVMLSFIAIWLFNDQGDGGKSSGAGTVVTALFSSTVVYAILPIVFWGLSGFLQKVATNHLTGEAAAFVYLVAFVPVGIVLALCEPPVAAATPRTWVLVLLLGFFLAFGNLAIVVAFARGGKAAVITPLGSLYPIISVPIAVAFLGEHALAREVIGIVCALGSVAALSFESDPANPQAPTTSATDSNETAD